MKNYCKRFSLNFFQSRPDTEIYANVDNTQLESLQEIYSLPRKVSSREREIDNEKISFNFKENKYV